jgi:DNA-binding response OmpR family regulator
MNKTILMVDDDETLVRIVKDILSPLSCAFHAAFDGASGIQQVRRLKPDLLLLDVNLPDMTGFDVCQAVRQDSAVRHTPILMLTAHFDRPTDKVTGLDLGADDYMLKPFENDLLLARVEAILRRSLPA